MNAAMFEGMMYIAIAGLGATVAEKFSSRNTNLQELPPINNRQPFYGTPLPKVQEKEI